MTGTPSHTPDERLLELLAGSELRDLSPEESAELEILLGQTPHASLPAVLGDLLVAADAAAGGPDMPSDVRRSLAARGRGLVNSEPSGSRGIPLWMPWTIAAALLLAAASGWWLYQNSRGQVAARDQQFALEAQQRSDRIAELEAQLASNDRVLATARSTVEQLQGELALRDGLIETAESRAARLAERELELAERLAQATADLDRARLRIEQYEAPVDPATLVASRTKLLEVPGTIRIDWQPFDLAGAPAEQRDVRGDVVWNDELEQGYLRFVGLDPNDPNIEQYQVWVIDDRGMEQKVSGGVFNASADGEIVVPIRPGIEVGRVALFAVTVEDPGGTWVPDLRRRVVVAPRQDG